MGLGVDWVAVVILLAAYAFSQVRSVPARVRYGVFAAASALVAIYKLRAGASGANLVLVLIAAGFAVYYGVRAVQAGRR